MSFATAQKQISELAATVSQFDDSVTQEEREELVKSLKSLNTRIRNKKSGGFLGKGTEPALFNNSSTQVAYALGRLGWDNRDINRLFLESGIDFIHYAVYAQRARKKTPDSPIGAALSEAQIQEFKDRIGGLRYPLVEYKPRENKGSNGAATAAPATPAAPPAAPKPAPAPRPAAVAAKVPAKPAAPGAKPVARPAAPVAAKK